MNARIQTSVKPVSTAFAAAALGAVLYFMVNGCSNLSSTVIADDEKSDTARYFLPGLYRGVSWGIFDGVEYIRVKNDGSINWKYFEILNGSLDSDGVKAVKFSGSSDSIQYRLESELKGGFIENDSFVTFSGLSEKIGDGSGADEWWPRSSFRYSKFQDLKSITIDCFELSSGSRRTTFKKVGDEDSDIIFSDN